MERYEKIKRGMELISEGCGDVGGISRCKMSQCPFADFCWEILQMKEIQLSPMHWKSEGVI